MNTNKRWMGFIFLMLAAIAGMPALVKGQKAQVSEITKEITTYPFGDPSPVPIITQKLEIYPYSRFDGYSLKASSQKWKVVTLENEYIKLSVLPQVGGKIWGAIEKSTGNDFIYKNDVLKFRDVGLRGPWTSGGIEFNFGYFGHTPTTAAPVDYILQKNDDGSVSCFIGDLDLASRTQWRVEIRLPKDAAAFQTRGFWYNATPLNQSYYYWSNAAIHTGDSLQYYFPGNHYIGHRGDVHPWPMKAGRNLSIYRNNDFGSSKSYHVLGDYAHYYGAYQHQKEVGFGHWARFDELPRQKIWIWALSRAGGIWENLLTDDNGQYSEVQAGRLFNQAMLESGFSSPFNQYIFSPQAADHWKEYWFPVKDIGGISDASPQAALHVVQGSAVLQIWINAIGELHDTLTVVDDKKTIHQEAVDLQPMEVFNTKVAAPSAQKNYTVTLDENLRVSTNPQHQDTLQRALISMQKYDTTSASGLYERGNEAYAFRHYDDALKLLKKSLDKDGNNIQAMQRIAEIYTRKNELKKALHFSKQVLASDTYDAEGNFIYGVVNRRLGNLTEAKEAFGWAARSMKYRSAGWEQMAELNISQHRWNDAIYYAQKSLNFNTFNIKAKRALTIAYRKEHNMQKATAMLTDMLKEDPLSHFAYFEKYLLDKTRQNKKSFTSLIRNELPHETYIELAMAYHNMGLNKEAKEILEMSPSNPIVNYWLAYLYKNDFSKSDEYLQKALMASPEFVFPFRHETITALQWAINQDNNWKAKYYLGLILWSKGRDEEALKRMNDCGRLSDYAPFYLSRSYLREDSLPILAKKDIQRALELVQDEWRAYRRIGNWFMARNQYDEAADILDKAFNKFSKNYYIGSQYAQALYKQAHYKKSLAVLNNLQVLPSEGARHSHDIFAKDHLMLALKNSLTNNYSQASKQLKASRTWPEHLGTGKPFKPDERAQNFLKAYIFDAQHKSQLRDSLYQIILAYSDGILESENTPIQFSFNNVAAMLTYVRQGEQQKAKKLLNNFTGELGTQNLMVDWLKSKVSGKIYGHNKLEQLLNRNTSSIPLWFTALIQLNKK